MNYADVFVRTINPEKSTITYEVRDKNTGILVEPRRETPFIVNDITKMVHFDAREVPFPMFSRAYECLIV